MALMKDIYNFKYIRLKKLSDNLYFELWKIVIANRNGCRCPIEDVSKTLNMDTFKQICKFTICESKENDILSTILRHDSNRLDTENYKELVTFAVTHNGEAIVDIVKKKINDKEWMKDIYKLAVQQKGEYLKYVDCEYQTEEIIDIALQENPEAKQYIKIPYDEFNLSSCFLK